MLPAKKKNQNSGILHKFSKLENLSSVYLQEARVRPDREMKLGRICNKQHVAVNVYGRSDRPEEEGEDVTGLVWGNNDGCAEVLHLKQDQKKCCWFLRL